MIPMWLRQSLDQQFDRAPQLRHWLIYGKGGSLDLLPFTTGTTASALTRVCQRALILQFDGWTELPRRLAPLQIEDPTFLEGLLTLTDAYFLDWLTRLQGLWESR